MPAVSAFVASLADYIAFWHEVPIDRLICAEKIVLFVVRNDFSTPHRKECSNCISSDLRIIAARYDAAM